MLYTQHKNTHKLTQASVYKQQSHSRPHNEYIVLLAAPSVFRIYDLSADANARVPANITHADRQRVYICYLKTKHIVNIHSNMYMYNMECTYECALHRHKRLCRRLVDKIQYNTDQTKRKKKNPHLQLTRVQYQINDLNKATASRSSCMCVYVPIIYAPIMIAVYRRRCGRAGVHA